MAKQKKKVKKHNPAHAFRYLRQPYARSALQAHQKSVISQHQFLAAQNAMQDRINHIQRMSFTGNPYIR